MQKGFRDYRVIKIFVLCHSCTLLVKALDVQHQSSSVSTETGTEQAVSSGEASELYSGGVQFDPSLENDYHDRVFFNIILTVHRDKLNYKTNEMHFFKFYFVNILYMFRIGKLFIFRKQFYCTCSLWYVSC